MFPLAVTARGQCGQNIHMCGIIGFTGQGNSPERLLEGLYALEYRGYDSAGIAVFDEGERLRVIKAKGRIDNVAGLIRAESGITGSKCGIGHTRWATHGEPSDSNSHPHGDETVQLVHNGIIENYVEIREKLRKAGVQFSSETDTEVAALLLSENNRQTGDHIAAIRKTLGEIIGSYAFAIVFADRPGVIYATKKASPLIVGLGKGENFVASDITAILRHTNRYYTLEEGEIAIVKRDNVTVLSPTGGIVEKEEKTADWDVEAAEKGGYPHFMIKEINEEPKAVEKTLFPRIKNGLPSFAGEKLDTSVFARVGKIYTVACGTAMYAGLIGKHMFESVAHIQDNVEIASEFRYNNPLIGKDDLVIVVSQSGETADTLEAMRLAKRKGAATLAVVNVVGSQIAREADNVLYTWAGPEISVASTKAYTVQASLLSLLAIEAALVRGETDSATAAELCEKLLSDVPRAIKAIIKNDGAIKAAAMSLKSASDLFYIGRGCDYYLACEGSLKLKEISYIHSEAYAAGELKHGTISLIEKGTPVIAVATVDRLYEKMLSNIKEVKARGARVILVCKDNARDASSEADTVITLPQTDELFAPIPAATVLQLIAYYSAVDRGCDVDKPRNLAKSVTVE